jgi:hypothetical protein
MSPNQELEISARTGALGAPVVFREIQRITRGASYLTLITGWNWCA